MLNMCTGIHSNNINQNEQNLIPLILEKLIVTDTDIAELEKATRGEIENDLWYDMRSGRLTASKHHEIYTKSKYGS